MCDAPPVIGQMGNGNHLERHQADPKAHAAAGLLRTSCAIMAALAAQN
jgi:hypothetical protein